jgi:hypothetical protein
MTPLERAVVAVYAGTPVPQAAVAEDVPVWTLRRKLSRAGAVLPKPAPDRMAFVVAMGRLGIPREKAWAWANEIPNPLLIASHQVEVALDAELQRVRRARRSVAPAEAGDAGVEDGPWPMLGAGSVEPECAEHGVEAAGSAGAAVSELQQGEDGR